MVRLFQSSTCFERVCSKYLEGLNKRIKKMNCTSSWSPTRRTF